MLHAGRRRILGTVGKAVWGSRTLHRAPPPQSSLFFLCITSSCLPADVENFLCSPLPPFSGQPGCHGNCILLGLGVEGWEQGRGDGDAGLWALSVPLLLHFQSRPCPTPATTGALAPGILVNVPPQRFPPLVLCLHLVRLSHSSLSLHLFLDLHPSSSHSCRLWAGYHSVHSQARPSSPAKSEGGLAWSCPSPHKAAGAGVAFIPASAAPLQRPPPQLPWKGSMPAAPLQTCLPPV